MFQVLFTSIAFAAPASHVAFDAVSVEAEVPKPAISWIQGITTRLCSDTSDSATVECQVNTDYNTIVKLCRGLREADISMVSMIASESQTVKFNALSNPKWLGCVHNEKTGWEFFQTYLSHSDGELIMYDKPSAWYRCDSSEQECGADGALDSWSRSNKTKKVLGDAVAYHPSYILSVYKYGKHYKTVPSTIMDEIEKDVYWYDFDGTRPDRPRMDLPDIFFLSGSLAVFRGKFTTGILFQSLTNHNYNEVLK